MQCPNNPRRYPLPCPRLESEGKCSVNNCSSSDVGRRRPEATRPSHHNTGPSIGATSWTVTAPREALHGSKCSESRHKPAWFPMPLLHLHALQASTSNTDKRLICVPPGIPVSAQQLQGTHAYGAATGQEGTGTGPGPDPTAPQLTKGKGRSEEPVQHLERGAEVTCTKR